MHTKVKLLGGCRCGLYSNYWGRYSQIGGIYFPTPLGFGTPVCENMKQRQTKVEETFVGSNYQSRLRHKTKPSNTPSLYAVGLCLWYRYKPKARQQFLLHMRLHFRVKEFVQCSLFVNRSWHQELGFRSYVWSLSHMVRSSKIYSTIQHKCKRQRC